MKSWVAFDVNKDGFRYKCNKLAIVLTLNLLSSCTIQHTLTYKNCTYSSTFTENLYIEAENSEEINNSIRSMRSSELRCVRCDVYSQSEYIDSDDKS